MKLITAITALLLMGVACQHNPGSDQDAMSEGSILGADLGMCITCGGWLIEIDDQIYHFGSVPLESGIDLENETFPLTVRLTWREDPEPTWIVIESIVKI
ncbi:MAG: hypothetical protein GXO91_08975 [FCB group bacterium]|nr:hypothetical protein [FCB group bacterium]